MAGNNTLESSWNDFFGKRAPTLAHVAAMELREHILSGELEPGQPLLLAETAERLGMSIMPVREALRRLEFEGLIEQTPQKGARVSSLNTEDLEDIYHARIVMESRAAYRAALRFTDESYNELLGTLREYKQAYERNDVDRGRQAHERFHFGLYSLSGSGWMIRLIRLLWDTSERFRRQSLYQRGSIQERYNEHANILEACHEGKAELAAELMGEHLERTLQIVKADIEGGKGLDK